MEVLLITFGLVSVCASLASLAFSAYNVFRSRAQIAAEIYEMKTRQASLEAEIEAKVQEIVNLNGQELSAHIQNTVVDLLQNVAEERNVRMDSTLSGFNFKSL